MAGGEKTTMIIDKIGEIINPLTNRNMRLEEESSRLMAENHVLMGSPSTEQWKKFEDEHKKMKGMYDKLQEIRKKDEIERSK